jgi:two-component system LytT family sensor kinase
MHPAEHIPGSPVKIFKVSNRVIWLSSLFMGILASIPKILQLHITLFELGVDAVIAVVFSLFVWYYNLYSLPKYAGRANQAVFVNRRLLRSLLLGVLLMVFLVFVQHLLFPAYNFPLMAMMYQFRGILINCTIYLFLHLLYQNHQTQLIGMELERTKADNLGAQFELLKQQVNPHFLFNSLSTLKAMIEIEDEHAADFTQKLSDFYRFTLENRKEDLILLSEELHILEAYLFLLTARFEEGISLEVTIPAPIQQSLIPPFTLQLLVENCIKHNVVSLEQPLQIRIFVEGEALCIANKLQLKKNPEQSTQLGLENINERYIHLLDKKIAVSSTATFFTVKLPLIYADTDY